MRIFDLFQFGLHNIRSSSSDNKKAISASPSISGSERLSHLDASANPTSIETELAV
ncbi:hypothetical protein FNYG_10627 [Fusarium nygamai]|uniref:Uncharacterized protein n=1 Tax=Gibberella nygamai TaxID=42673 RepID=A0A2K0W1B9_GIBNY|nr:hypothetical protein FNYG_10627 [Fusarium nygamai]